MRIKASYDQKSTAFIYYFFAFLLLWEWLRPLQEFTDTANTFIFVFFVGVSFILTFLKARWFITFPVKIMIILFILHGLFFEGVFFGFSWFGELVNELFYNLSLIPEARWMDITSAFRTLLFFILLWLLVYLIHYWILFQRRILFFFIITMIYITVLDTFATYDATFAVVRTVIVGFFLLGLLYFERLRTVEKLNVKKFAKMRWILPLFAFIALSTVLGLLAPKAAPQWPDPVPYLTAYGRVEEGQGAGVKKIGYGTNDQQLGGPFIADDTEVFNHVSADRHYWRIETKDVYTGRGWDVSDPNAKSVKLAENKVSWFDEDIEVKSLSSQIEVANGYPHYHVMYPLGVTELDLGSSSELFVNPVTELISSRQADDTTIEMVPSSYSVNYDMPIYKINELENTIKDDTLPEGFLERYTQLPDTLPDRVGELAAEITSDEENLYDKAKAIERHLGSIEFTYETTDVAIPGENEDYVDQFLFETLKGYCDNFSTSMIVLLHSIDIPARWVKGYTEGEFQEIVESGVNEYEVTNNNAHSWVEVYFEGIGWVPFEPTKSFSNPYDFTYDFEDSESAEEEEDEEDAATPTPERPVQEEDTDQNSASKGFTLFNVSLGDFRVYLFILIVGVIAFAVYITRMKWLPKLIIYRYKNRKDEDAYFKAYDALLKQFERIGLKRREGQTLREYALYIDRYFNIRDMTYLTKNYERALYRNDNAKEEWVNSVELWENLIKRTSS
ncbi:DUF4129 domain-containing transglutaminase family protein [Metabacillus herbersteinensis]|uniref:DUF4129 domain-containing transglutaminase family protein n=1 Tax=Metabacillus herbersteinensis TaxID=283816 RepID=A0ABV6GNV9_9BACI